MCPQLAAKHADEGVLTGLEVLTTILLAHLLTCLLSLSSLLQAALDGFLKLRFTVEQELGRSHY